LAHLPTPLERPERLCEALGIELWVKRDDATGGAEAGNKIRKLEFLLAEALERGADTVITCGGIQSNHARATALLAARLGLAAVLFLRVQELDDDGDGAGIVAGLEHAALGGNVLLDQLAGAELRLITLASYRRRAEVMQRHADRLSAQGARPYVIPEGGSNGLGALGYVHAMSEIRDQLSGDPFDVLVHACGSGGTLAGCALGAAQSGVAKTVRGMAVCDDAAYFERTVKAIMSEARSLEAGLGDPAPWTVDDRFKGPGYAQSTPDQRRVMAEAARLSGLVFDPVYTGKAFFGLWEMALAGELRDKRVLFVHTGGLPGLLAQAQTFAR
jgi:D-cysteine desulfhydrase